MWNVMLEHDKVFGTDDIRLDVLPYPYNSSATNLQTWRSWMHGRNFSSGLKSGEKQTYGVQNVSTSQWKSRICSSDTTAGHLQ